MTRTYLIATGIGFSVASLLFSCAENPKRSTPETSLLMEQADLPAVPNRKSVFDSAGMQPAFLAFLKNRYGEQAVEAGQLLHPYWKLLTSIDESRSVVPCSTVLDESEGFNALFVERWQGRFSFILIGEISNPERNRQTGIEFPENMAQLAKTLRDMREPEDAVSAGMDTERKRSLLNR